MAKQNNFIVDQIFRGEQNVINPLLVGQSIIPNFNKNMPNLFEKLAGGGRNNPQDVIFRKVNSLLQDGD